MQEKKRAEELAAREKRVQDTMDRMGEVLKKSDDAEKKQDIMILNGIMKKDKEAEEKEK